MQRRGLINLSATRAHLCVVCMIAAGATELSCKPGPAPNVAAPQSLRRTPTVLWFGGDTHLGDSHSPLFSQPIRALSGAIGVLNLEGPVRLHATEVSEQHLRTSAHALGTLRSAGVQVVTIANNHIHDDGADGVATTQTLCTAAGLAVVGPQLQPHFLPTDNGTVAFIAADLSQPQPAPLGEIAAAVSAAKHNSAWVVVSFHTAGPALYRPSAVLRSAADRVLAAGASIVVAHGSHTVAPVERRAEAVVAWGLGNLVFNCDCSIETEGMLLRVELTAGQPIRASVIPLQAGVAGASAVVYGPEGASFALFAAMGGATLQVDAGLGSF